MARPPPDPRVTDLRRYRRERQRAQRRPAPRPQAPNESLLGSRPRAGLILVLVVVVAAALWILPRLLH
jgi:hypothetical protein